MWIPTEGGKRGPKNIILEELRTEGEFESAATIGWDGILSRLGGIVYFWR